MFPHHEVAILVGNLFGPWGTVYFRETSHLIQHWFTTIRWTFNILTWHLKGSHRLYHDGDIHISSHLFSHMFRFLNHVFPSSPSQGIAGKRPQTKHTTHNTHPLQTPGQRRKPMHVFLVLGRRWPNGLVRQVVGSVGCHPLEGNTLEA